MTSNLRKQHEAKACKEDLIVTLVIILSTSNLPLCHWPMCMNILGHHLSLGASVPQVTPKKTSLGRTRALSVFLHPPTLAEFTTTSL